MALLTLVGPTTEPVTLQQMKLFARVDFPDDDALWPALIASARQWCEVYCQRRFIVQTMRLLMDFFPGYIDFKLAGQRVSSPFISGSNSLLVGIRYAIALPYPRVQSILNLTYIDTNGNPQTLPLSPAGSGGPFLYDLSSEPARLAPNVQDGTMWPVALVTLNAVQVDYTTGYGQQIPVTLAASGATIGSTYTFLPTDVGAPLCIPGAGPGGAALQTTIATVVAGVGTVATAATTAVTAAPSYLGTPVPEAIQIAIMRYALGMYESRSTGLDPRLLKEIKGQLAPYRDLRL